MTGKVMAVDPGEKRIGLAVSDETATLARGLVVLKHKSLIEDCQEIINIAAENNVNTIIVGVPYSDDGEERPQTRHAQKIVMTLSELTSKPIILWDESDSTRMARSVRLESGARRKTRTGHLDAVAAAIILQSWLDWQKIEDDQNA